MVCDVFCGVFPFGRLPFPFVLELVLLFMAFGGRSLCALFVVLAEGWFAFAETGRAATTPGPLKTPGFWLAAMAGLPWFCEARSPRFELAAC